MLIRGCDEEEEEEEKKKMFQDDTVDLRYRIGKNSPRSNYIFQYEIPNKNIDKRTVTVVSSLPTTTYRSSTVPLKFLTHDIILYLLHTKKKP